MYGVCGPTRLCLKVDVHRANGVGHQPPNHLTMGARKSVLADQRKPPHAQQAGAQCGAAGDEEGSNPTRPAPHCEGSLDPPQTPQSQFETFPSHF